MRKFIQLGTISVIAVLISLTVMPGCDELVTETYYDTIFEYIDSVYVYYDTTIYNDTNFYVDTIYYITDSNCIICHSDLDNSIELSEYQWQNSAHSSFDLIDTASSCGPQCHSEKGFVADLKGLTMPEYLFTPIGCFACHTYHETSDFGLRIDSISPQTLLSEGDIIDYNNSNICVSCHQSIYSQTALIDSNIIADDTLWYKTFDWMDWERHGSTQADMFSGNGGYEFTTITPSGHPIAITDGCITCHQDSTNGLTLGGHTLNMRSGSDFLVEGCNVTNCHIDEPLMLAIIDNYQTEFVYILDSLGRCLDAMGLVDSVGDSIIIAGAQFADAQGIDTGSIGAMYNYFYARNDKSKGVHNWSYDSALIWQSIGYLDSILNPPPPK